MSNSLDSDQNQHSVRPYLGSNCLKRLSADDEKSLLQESYCTGDQLRVGQSSE